MFGYFVRRVLWIAPVLLTVTFITFILMHRAPGGPWDQEKPVPAATQAALNAKFGLDKPLWFNANALSLAWSNGERNPFALSRTFLDTQFFNYVIGAAQGDLGPTYQSKGTEDVQSVLLRKFPTTAKVGIVAIAFAVIVGIPLGIISALRQNSPLDYASLFVATAGISIPNFIVGVLLIIFLSSFFGIPAIRRPEDWEGFGAAYLLPGLVLGLGTMAFIMRLTRSSMLEIKRQDYVRTARAKGLADRMVVGRHMLRNALIPVITILGPAIANLVTGSFIIENVFNVPGMGREFVTSISSRDYSMIMGTTLFYALLVAFANLTVDLSYGVLDPRIRARD
ncbi:MAG: Oligopeptide transport system permease protein OppB [Chloroflexi bacterium AL-W]|nr:Oligopeptide transport system permease protein OppB [Chloroflexi bacterium AL-N1]NOK68992.1 Oligopeptide transport system permease protein OppB [Chloroflexi bacterium AL-N10]NOK76975.1 Oligopeptide transport system permease protein OppB [Chloroflexi bacterium AL-N5]NOK82637.1 Oligopeptide transport system permease protein OppB [Chloroflexi bacterium AL-W]NOK90832.1 Oligopeptide transport system permease protein OppB [Chloroflexi bacterium AL-N15]